MHPSVAKYRQVMAEAMPCEKSIEQACDIQVTEVPFAEVVIFQGPMARALRLRAEEEQGCVAQTLTSAFAEYLNTPPRTFRQYGSRRI